MTFENKFYNVLENIFIGAKFEGSGGYINLLKIKERYYSEVLEIFKKEVDRDFVITGDYREEFFNKLYNFFVKYFSESGSVYYVNTANWQNIYEKIYSNNEDVVLFWKTHMLYYVKSDVLFNNIEIKVKDNDVDYVAFFDVSNMVSNKGNEKRDLVFEYVGSEKKKNSETNDEYLQHTFTVEYSTRGRKTKTEDLAKVSGIPEYVINRLMKEFKKQSSVDFFINKNAEEFLGEQLDIYINQILLDESNIFEQERLDQLKKIKEYGRKLISLIAQFENELVKIWNKPKFVLNSNYVMSLKMLKENLSSNSYEKLISYIKSALKTDENLIEDVSNIISEIYKSPLQKIYLTNIKYGHDSIELSYAKGFQTEEKRDKYLKRYEDQKIYDKEIFDRGNLIDSFFATYNTNNITTEISYEDLYIDTKYLPVDYKLEILEELTQNTPLDSLINGYLVKSDNYQFLNTTNKFNGEVKLCYIDPPFNTEGSYAYLDKFRDSTWLTMISNRLELLNQKFLNDESSFFLHLDHHGSHFGRMLADDIFGELNREIVWNTSPSISGLKAVAPNFVRQHDTIFYYKGKNADFKKMYSNYQNLKVEDLGWLDMFEEEEDKPFIYKYLDANKLEKVYLGKVPTMALGDVWNDVFSMMYTQNMTRENWSVDNTQKPENLLRRVIQSTTSQRDLVMDFYVGTGTTIAAAHKLNRRWIGVDAGEFIDSITLTRMKTVIMGDIRPKLSIDLNWTGGGVMKYYELEQYEDTLNNSIYSEEQTMIFDEKNPFSSYIFFSDNKLADALSLNAANEIELRFEGVYRDIDWAESISNLLGLPISQLGKNYFTLTDGVKELRFDHDYENMTEEERLKFIEIIKPLIWWGE